MLTRRTAAGLIVAGFAAGAGRRAFGQVGGDINVAPKRLVFPASAVSGTVYLFNRGGAPAAYNISLVDRVMLPNGDVQAAEGDHVDPAALQAAAGLKSAKPLLVYTPRRVTLNPGESQTIRLRVLRPADLPAGEYRTHLTVSAIPPEDVGLTADQAAGLAPGQLAARVVAVFALSIPLIVRQGPVDVRAALESARYRPPAPGDAAPPGGTLALDLVRVGASSLFGDIEVRAGDAHSGDAHSGDAHSGDARSGEGGALLGAVRGVAVYPEIPRRPVTVALQRPPPAGAALKVLFRDQDSRINDVLATTSCKVA